MENNKTKIGWIGLGTMGTPMSKKLTEAGYDVTFYNRSARANTGVDEQKIASSPAEIIDVTDVIFLMVSDDHAIREIFTGETGLLKPTTTGKIIVNMSTVSPAISREMA